MARASFCALLLLSLAALAVAITTAAPATTTTPPPPEPPQPGPPERWEWRECVDSAPHVKHALEVEDLCVDPFPIQTGKPWTLDIALKHRGRHEIRAGVMTLRVYALKHILVYSTTQDFCASSKKKEAALVNMIARRGGVEVEAGDNDNKKEGAFVNMIARRSGCPLRAGEKTMLHFEGIWSSWAPESDKYVLRVMVHSHEHPNPTNELMCVDIDVVARKPPSSSSSSSVAAS